MPKGGRWCCQRLVAHMRWEDALEKAGPPHRGQSFSRSCHALLSCLIIEEGWQRGGRVGSLRKDREFGQAACVDGVGSSTGLCSALAAALSAFVWPCPLAWWPVRTVSL